METSESFSWQFLSLKKEVITETLGRVYFVSYAIMNGSMQQARS